MKNLQVFLFLLSILTISLISCEKEKQDIEMQCEFEDAAITIEPLCEFNPKNLQSTHFPVRVVYNGKSLTHPAYKFNWSKDDEFHGSAISVSYEELPLTVTITEDSTSCVASTKLEKAYWD